MQYKWLSAYIFYSGPAEVCLRGFIKPFAEKVRPQLHPLAPYFFIRYGEGGPHIRFRLQTSEAHLANLQIMLEDEVHMFSDMWGVVKNVSDREIVLSPDNDCIKFVQYIPETSRYGNPDTLMLAERQFFLSSQYSLQRISQPSWDISTALAVAFQMHIAFFYALQADISTIRNICEHFIGSWLASLTVQMKDVSLTVLLDHMNELYARQSDLLNRRAIDLWKALEAGSASADLQEFAYDNRSILEEYQASGLPEKQFHSVLRSLLHMTHNRLGISNKEEPWCIYVTQRCLLYIYESIS
jgi:thiopeptide-type bacteriocin biosynthesis protein